LLPFAMIVKYFLGMNHSFFVKIQSHRRETWPWQCNDPFSLPYHLIWHESNTLKEKTNEVTPPPQVPNWPTFVNALQTNYGLNHLQMICLYDVTKLQCMTKINTKFQYPCLSTFCSCHICSGKNIFIMIYYLYMS
jgi:hypothetical protein